MKLLVITQIVDETDSNLGFFHNWLLKLAAEVDHLYVICLKVGKHTLPTNVTVLSLGKEKGVGRLEYLKNFYQFIWQYRREYNHVFVHMNPEYVVLGGLFWKAWHKKVLLWYTHKSVNLKLRLAEKLVTGVFTSSVSSFRLPSHKVQVVGHGIDLAEFADKNILPAPNKITLFSAGRISRSKDLETLLSGVAQLKKLVQIPILLEIAGAAITPADDEYFIELKNLVTKLEIEDEVVFLGGLKRPELRQAFFRNALFVHSSQTGSMDKVVLEALACGRPVLTSSVASYADAIAGGVIFSFIQGQSSDLAKNIAKLYDSGILDPAKLPNVPAIEYIKNHHNLNELIKKIITYFS